LFRFAVDYVRYDKYHVIIDDYAKMKIDETPLHQLGMMREKQVSVDILFRQLPCLEALKVLELVKDYRDYVTMVQISDEIGDDPDRQKIYDMIAGL
jgi:hypothetical protein